MMKKGLFGCSLSNQIIVIGVAYCVSAFSLNSIYHLQHLTNPARDALSYQNKVVTPISRIFRN